jgi:hypothetical protein
MLAAFALSDDCHRSRVDTQNGIICFSVVSKALRGLFTAYREKTFRDARAAAAILAQQLNLSPSDRNEFRRHLDESKEDGAHTPSVVQAFEVLRQGVIAAETVGINDSVEFWIPDAASLDFGGLRRLIDDSIEAKRR